MRVGIIALLHESNTFISEPTTLEKFEHDTLATGEDVRNGIGSSHHEVAGFFDGLANTEVEAVPLFAARTMPFGTITADTYNKLTERLFRELENAGELDGLLVAPHGATVSAEHPDADGYWLSRVRERVGDDIPIISTIDPHANLSQRMVEACDATIAYRTNPHLDQKIRGREAAELIVRTLRGEIRPTQAAVFPPIAISIESQHTFDSPCKPYYEFADRMRQREDVLSLSVVLGFPYADVEEMGSSVVVVTNNNPELAQQLATKLAEAMWERRHSFLGEFIDVETAVAQAVKLDGPVCLLDMGDNVGGGSPGDSTYILHELHRRGVSQAFVCLWDPKAAAAARSAGIGATVELTVGGKTDDLHGKPLTETFTIRGLYDGKFYEPEVRHGGFTHGDQGPTAVVETSSGLTVMLTTERMPPFSSQQLKSCELDPRSFHAIVAKGVNLPIASYGEICSHFVHVNTAGVTTADMRNLTFQHRRRPMLPFEPDTSWDKRR